MKKLLSFMILILIVSVSFAQLGGSGKGYTKAQSDAKYLTKSDSSALITSPNYVTKKALQIALSGVVGESTDTTYLSARIDSMVNKYTLVDPTSLIDSIASVSTINAQTASYTATISDLGKTITINSASATTFTMPLFSVVAFPLGTTINVIRLGAGDVTIAITATGTLQSESSWVKIGAQYSGVTLLKIATDTWVILGRLKA